MLHNPAWLFAFATLLASFAIIIIFKSLLNKIVTINSLAEEEHADLLQKETINFFKRIALAEIIPIIILVYGIMQMNDFTGSFDEMLLPLIIMLVSFILTLIIVFISSRQVQEGQNLAELLKMHTATFMMIGIATSSMFPLISFVMIYLLT